MPLFADLHIHSRFSRATSRDLSLVTLQHWAQRKGLTLVGTGDFTHPAWRAELTEQLEEAEPWLFRLREPWRTEAERQLPRSCRGPVRFVLQVEISTIYKADGATRKVHHLILCPSLAEAEKFSVALEAVGNVTSDGRPILGLDSRDLLEIMLENCPGGCLIPAHVWTPWFSVLGSKSGFDRVEACYRDLTSHIFAVETGLSSDPPMNWRLSGLDRFALVSNSDAHSPAKLGRECNEFDTELSYDGVINALRQPTRPGFLGTVEFFPEEGKYHLDGHRKCQVRLEPEQTRELDGRCPECGRPLTVGVMHRVEALADRHPGERPALAAPFRRLIALAETVGHALGCGPATRRVERVTGALQEQLGPELFLLRQVDLERVERVAGDLVAEALRRVRLEEVRWRAGFDGEYGRFEIFRPEERAALSGQFTMFTDGLLGAPPPSRETRPEAPPVEAAGRRPRPAPGHQAASAEAPTPPRSGNPEGRGAQGGGQGEASAAEGSDQTSAWLARLGEDQLEAVLYAQEAPLLIVAGPGTGKTRTLTTRIAHRVETGRLRPEQVLALTFSQRAAAEMAARLGELLGQRGLVRTATFHAWGLGLLRQLGRARRTILGDDERLEMVKRAAQEVGLSGNVVRQLADALALAKAGRPPGPPEGVGRAEWDEFCAGYEAGLAAVDAHDFDDLVLKATTALTEARGDLSLPRAVFVDEYQDVNRAQVELLQALAPVELCAIGDPDQAIYGFRGADYRAVVDFAQDWPGAQQLALGRSYRSCPTVLRAATQVIQAGPGPQRPPLQSDVEGAPVVTVLSAPSEKGEGEVIARTIEQLLGGTTLLSFDRGLVSSGEAVPCGSLADVAVLYRLRAQGPMIAEALVRAGFPVQLARSEALSQDPTVALVVAGLRRLAGRSRPGEEELLREARKQRNLFADLSLTAAGKATTTLGELSQHLLGERVEGIEPLAPLWRAAQRIDRPLREGPANRAVDELLDWIALRDEADDVDRRGDHISLVTMHAAKGLEWPVVFVAGCEAGLVPLARPGSGTDLEEERRLLYVAMTRAERMLILSHAQGRRLYGQRLQQGASPFLTAIDESLLHCVKRPPAKRRRQLPLFGGS